MVKYLRLSDQAYDMAEQGNLRGACDKFKAATFAAPSVNAPHRFYRCFMMYTMILRELHFKPKNSDLTTLRFKFLENEDEPPHFRVQAAFALGVILSSLSDREQAADKYREGLSIARAASAKDRARMVESKDGLLSVDYLIKSSVATIESNLSILEGRGRTIPLDPSVQRRDYGKRDAMPNIGVVYHMREGKDGEELGSVWERATIVGGNQCDQCKKTLKDLGVERLDCCSRCEMAYYCSKPCQVKAWKAGHKQACREPNQIEVGDYMMLKGLAKRSELNDHVGRIQGTSERKGQWIVQLMDERKVISIPAGNLQHIRPAK